MINKNTVIRIARPTNELERIAKMYKDGLGLEIISEFRDHDGFDGIILGNKNCIYHLEFTQNKNEKVGGAPTKENLLVFYIESRNDYKKICSDMEMSGFIKVKSVNPYWERSGSSYEDPDGYRVVIYNEKWAK